LARAKGGSPNTSFGRRAGGGRPTRRWWWKGEAGVGMGTAGEVVAGGLGPYWSSGAALASPRQRGGVGAGRRVACRRWKARKKVFGGRG